MADGQPPAAAETAARVRRHTHGGGDGAAALEAALVRAERAEHAYDEVCSNFRLLRRKRGGGVRGGAGRAF